MRNAERPAVGPIHSNETEHEPTSGNLYDTQDEPVMRRAIAILFHASDRGCPLPYVIVDFARMWKEQGHTVTLLFGLDTFVPADIVVVHVDLSVVPPEYLSFAARYPLAVNGRVRDIRKSTMSTLLVRPGDGYDGPVIVKSDLNYAGFPERSRNLAGQAQRPVFASPSEYRVFAEAGDVPDAWYANPELVVERFVPEIDGGFYRLRHLHFLGDRVTCVRLASKTPVVCGRTMLGVEPCEPHDEMLELRAKMGFDYGKFDYVVDDGKPILLDANKTTGALGGVLPPAIAAGRRYRADGIHSFFKDT